MTEKPLSVRKFDAESAKLIQTRLVIELIPAPDGQYLGSWDLELCEDENGCYDLEELEALTQETFAAAQQLERLSQMFIANETEE